MTSGAGTVVLPMINAAETVRDIVLNRGATSSTPKNRTDGHRVALLIEGGGIRAVMTAGMVQALADLGLESAFDAVIGVSAGSCNAVSLISRTSTGLVDGYAEELTRPEFIQPRRILRGRPAIDVRRMVRHASAHVPYERFSRALTSDIPLLTVASNVSTAQAEGLTAFESLDDLQSAVTASCMLPLIGGRPVVHRGDRYIDGGILDPLGIETAQRWGATHAVMLLSRPADAKLRTSRLDQLAGRYLTSLHPGFEAPYRRRSAIYADQLQQAATGQIDNLPVLAVRVPTLSQVPSRLDRNVDRVRTAGHIAKQIALETFALHPVPPLRR